MPPGEFIPLAEELGLIEAIGDWVIDAMAAQQRAWAREGLDLSRPMMAKLIEQMEKEGVVSPANHVGKREVLAPEPRD